MPFTELTSFDFYEAFETLYEELNNVLQAEAEHLNEVPADKRDYAIERYDEHYELIRVARESVLKAKNYTEGILW